MVACETICEEVEVRGTSFMMAIAIAFVMGGGSAYAADVPASQPTDQRRQTSESPADSNDVSRTFGCAEAPPDLSACAPDDRKCEVASKMHGCVYDPRERKRVPPPRF
jgi:hypothetical protein